MPDELMLQAAAMMLLRRLDSARQHCFRLQFAYELHSQQGMQFHAVFRDANLAMKDIEECNAFNAYYPGRCKPAEVRLRGRKLRLQHAADIGKPLGLQ